MSRATSTEPQTHVDVLAHYLRQRYVEEVKKLHRERTGMVSNYGDQPIPRWDGGRGSDGRNYESIWPRIANFCRTNKLAPDRLISAVFARWRTETSHAKPPLPSQLVGDDVIRLVAEAAPAMLSQAKVRWQNQSQLFEREVLLRQIDYGRPEQDTVRQVLLDRDLQLSPLFRFVEASERRIEEVVQRFRELALMQYAFDSQLYDEVVGGRIPRSLVSSTTPLYRKVRT